tara:strand:+ start:490 stop:969 length:480 start_codon:yes stop_codon:yes gene_type:complete
MDIPLSSVGAPIPAVVAGEHEVAVLFYAQDEDPNWDGTTVRVVGADSASETCVIVRFKNACAHLFGPPNDEAISGHPLYSRGLEPHGNFEVLNSSWIRTLERMNSVHPQHDKKKYLSNRRHFVLAFHDSTFECVARCYEFSIHPGSICSHLVQIGPEVV